MLRIRLKWGLAGALPPQAPISGAARSAVPSKIICCLAGKLK